MDAGYPLSMSQFHHVKTWHPEGETYFHGVILDHVETTSARRNSMQKLVDRNSIDFVCNKQNQLEVIQTGSNQLEIISGGSKQPEVDIESSFLQHIPTTKNSIYQSNTSDSNAMKNNVKSEESANLIKDSFISRAEDWRDEFDTKAYLNTFYARELFSNMEHFLREYMKGILTKYHEMFNNGKRCNHGRGKFLKQIKIC